MLFHTHHFQTSEENPDIFYCRCGEIKNMSGKKVVENCPTCFGKGVLPAGFYDVQGVSSTGSSLGVETCRSCQGKGVFIL